MSHFYGSMTGRKGKTSTRCGDKRSGMTAHIRGWNVGVFVELYIKDGKDCVKICRTDGSCGNGLRGDPIIFQED